MSLVDGQQRRYQTHLLWKLAWWGGREGGKNTGFVFIPSSSCLFPAWTGCRQAGDPTRDHRWGRPPQPPKDHSHGFMQRGFSVMSLPLMHACPLVVLPMITCPPSSSMDHHELGLSCSKNDATMLHRKYARGGWCLPPRALNSLRQSEHCSSRGGEHNSWS